MARISVDSTKCAYLGVCESLAGKYFQLDDGGELLLPAGHEVDGADLDEVREAVLGCPTEALSLDEDAS
jgi:ferredoxin